MPIPVGKKRSSDAAGDSSRDAASSPVVLITGFTRNRIKTTASGQNQAYAASFSRALAVMEKDERQRPPPEKIAHLVERIITHPAPRLRYTAGTMSQRVGALLKRVLPGRLFEWLMMATYKLN
jgi:hypothetical protein